MLENNEDGVECMTWKDFMSGSSGHEITYFEKDLTRLKEILRRIFKRYHLKYILLDNNCEHFVNFCVHNKLSSYQADRGKKLIDSILSIIEVHIITHEDKSIRGAMDEWN